MEKKPNELYCHQQRYFQKLKGDVLEKICQKCCFSTAATCGKGHWLPDTICGANEYFIQISKEKYERLLEENTEDAAEQEAKEWEKKLLEELKKNQETNLEVLTLASADLMRELMMWARGQNDGSTPWPKWMNDSVHHLYEVLKSQGARID